MAQKIMVPKTTEKYEDYKANKLLILLFIIGYSVMIPYMIGYFYNLYFFFKIIDYFNEIRGMESVPDHLSMPTQSEIVQTIMVITALIYLAVVILSVILIYLDTKKLRVGTAFSKERFFKSITWRISSWTILTFFFWWFIFPLYLYRRKQIYRMNKEAYEEYMSRPLRAGGW